MTTNKRRTNLVQRGTLANTCDLVLANPRSRHQGRYLARMTPLVIDDLADAERELAKALEEVGRLRAVVEDWMNATEHLDVDPIFDSVYAPLIVRMMAENGLSGFGAMMSSCQRLWREALVDVYGMPGGGEFVAGPCRITLTNLLKRSRETLAHPPSKIYDTLPPDVVVDEVEIDKLVGDIERAVGVIEAPTIHDKCGNPFPCPCGDTLGS